MQSDKVEDKKLAWLAFYKRCEIGLNSEKVLRYIRLLTLFL